jgi:hypothetical protein
LNRRVQRLSTATKRDAVAQVGKNMKIIKIILYHDALKSWTLKAH